MTRAQFLRLMGSAAAYGAVGCPRFIFGDDGGLSRPERIARILRDYDSQGDHRTGTAVDAESGRWLADQVRQLGVEPVLAGIPFRRIDIEAAYLEIDGHAIQGVPLFDGGFTGADGISGALGAAGTAAEIGVMRDSPLHGSELSKHRRQGDHDALVVVTGGEPFGLPDGLALFNAGAYKRPFGPPTLQVGSESWPRLESAIATGSPARLVARVKRQPVEVDNVTATVGGTRADLAPLVVMTPRSGWWNCASERGGGLAVWLEMLRELQRSRPARSTHFVASTGHELGHVGLDHYLSTRTDLIQDAAAWIHLGANFGAAVGPDPMLYASDEELLTLTLDAMAAAGKKPTTVVPAGTRPRGEAIPIHEGGGRYISLVGGNGLFHHPHDRWPAAVDLEAVVRFANAFVEIGRRLTQA